MASEPKYTYTQGSDLPETVPSIDRSVHKYSVPESGPQTHTTVYALPNNDAQSPIPTYTETERPRAEQSKWTRWPLLLLYGLLLAIIAGLAGGFIGKTLERNNHSNDTALSATSETCPTSTPSAAAPPSPSPTSSPTSSISSALPTQSSTIFERTIASPSSGCTSDQPYRSFKSRSKFLNIPYTTICGQGWLGSDLTAMSTATQGDCIESCSTYNSHVNTGDRQCVGAGFIPAWWDQQLAMKESKITPYNCFLKTNTSGIARNNEEFEVVALCMSEDCDSIQG